MVDKIKHQVEDTPCIVIYSTNDLISPEKSLTQRLIPVDKVSKYFGLVPKLDVKTIKIYQLSTTSVHDIWIIILIIIASNTIIIIIVIISGVNQDCCELKFHSFGRL